MVDSSENTAVYVQAVLYKFGAVSCLVRLGIHGRESLVITAYRYSKSSQIK